MPRTSGKEQIGDEAYQKELTTRNLTTADMRDRLRRELIAQKVLEHEVGAKVTVSDQQVTDFFNANRAQFNLPEDALHLAQIIVTPVRDQQIANRTRRRCDDATGSGDESEDADGPSAERHALRRPGQGLLRRSRISSARRRSRTRADVGD